MTPDPYKGRGSTENIQNRFEKIHIERDPDSEEEDIAPKTVFLRDSSRTLITYNSSPDLGFEASFNVYRGCEHGCSYCFARPYHEYLGMSSGLDFETKILVKENAPELLRAELAHPTWKPQTLVMSGVTDCYQPVERRLKLTRQCLEVLAEVRNPVAIITKNALVTRDIDVLQELAHYNAVSISVSVTSLDAQLASKLEPRASTPKMRIDAIRQLNAAGIPAGPMIGPVIPGLNDHEIPAILEAAAGVGARFANYVLLRLPYGVKDIFQSWLEKHVPERAEKVLHRIRETRDGKLYDARWSVRGRGTGSYAENIGQLFKMTRAKAGIPTERGGLSTEAFRRPKGPQLDFFNV